MRTVTALCATAMLLLAACGSDNGDIAVDTDTVETPDVVGMEYDDAADTLRDVGLRPAQTRSHDDDVPEDVVLAQDPSAGDETDVGDRVELEVSAGPLEEEEDEAAEVDEEADQEGTPEEEPETNDPAEDTSSQEQQAAPDSDDAFEIVETGVSFAVTETHNIAAIGAAITNTADVSFGQSSATFTVRDASGTALGSTNEFLGWTNPGATIYYGTEIYLDDPTPEPVSVEVVIDPGNSTSDTRPELEVSGQRYSTDGRREYLIGEAHNPTSSTLSDVPVSCVGYRGGQIIYGSNTYTGNIGAGSSGAFEARLWGGTHGEPDEVRCTAAHPPEW